MQPYWIVELPDEKALHKIANRCVSLRFALELWGHSTELSELHKSLREYPSERIKPYICKDKSFKIMVETFCKHFTQKEKVQKIEVRNWLELLSLSISIIDIIRVMEII